MNKVRSKDSTLIAFDRVGQGPGLMIIGGALSTRKAAAGVAASLAPHFTVYAYDRRGRGDSGDTQPYAVEREVEDLEALIDDAGGTAYVFGHSSGAVLAMEATRQLPGKILRLAVYEPPFIIDHTRPPVPGDYIGHLNELIAAGCRSEAVSYFMTSAVGIPSAAVAHMQAEPMWPGLEAIAHTLPYDGMIMGDTMSGNPLVKEHWASITISTLVMDGGASPAYMHHSAETLASLLPHARHLRFPGQQHGIPAEILAPALMEFFIG